MYSDLAGGPLGGKGPELNHEGWIRPETAVGGGVGELTLSLVGTACRLTHTAFFPPVLRGDRSMVIACDISRITCGFSTMRCCYSPLGDGCLLFILSWFVLLCFVGGPHWPGTHSPLASAPKCWVYRHVPALPGVSSRILIPQGIFKAVGLG